MYKFKVYRKNQRGPKIGKLWGSNVNLYKHHWLLSGMTDLISRIVVEQQQKHIQVNFCMHYVHVRTTYSKQDRLGLNLGPATYQLCDFQ